MSVTRQRGNRIAYDRLVDDLRHTPDVFPTIFQTQTFGRWEEPATYPRLTGLLDNGSGNEHGGQLKSSRLTPSLQGLIGQI